LAIEGFPTAMKVWPTTFSVAEPKPNG